MISVLIVLLDVLLVALVILILLKFRFDRVGLRIDMSWRSVRLLLCTVAAEAVAGEKYSPEDREKLQAFMKCKKQAKQIARANELKAFFTIPEEDAADYASRCARYNEAVKQLDQMLGKPLWHFVATVFRVKPQPMLETFDIEMSDENI